MESDAKDRLVQWKGIREIFACGLRNPGLWNSEYNSRNPDIKFYWQRFGILGTGVVSRIQDSLGIPFHGTKKTVYMQEENSLPGGLGKLILALLVSGI